MYFGFVIRLVLKPGRDESLRRRHPWVFSGAIARATGDGSDGVAEVVDSSGQLVGCGAYSPHSQIVARIWSFDGRPPDLELFRERFAVARRLREEVLPPETTGYRGVNSEGDLCPGVLVDRFDEVGVMDLTTEGTVRWRGDLEQAAAEVFHPAHIFVRESGVERDRARLAEATPSPRPSPDRRGGRREPELAPFLENGLRFFADVAGGQKTGFFLDQRENRSRLRATARGRSVLDLFSYSGAFSVAALAGGAARAVDVDSSESALALAREHRRANGFAVAEEDFIRADVFEDVRLRVAAGESWDVVVCDPPAFARKRGDLSRAARGYQDVNRLAMSLVAPGGWLLTCSCSGLVTADLFQKIVFSASLEAHRTFALAARQGAGPDHPISLDCPEGEYLKGLWLRRQT
ncbi:MAG TPA: class I SAM-dependent rRNA methyltransferase [Thermoanaerobaculia bacterium]|nr:class I SAM-dependent rRNA methyltransferase [Thermoanaerobaculia bacterium]